MTVACLKHLSAVLILVLTLMLSSSQATEDRKQPMISDNTPRKADILTSSTSARRVNLTITIPRNDDVFLMNLEDVKKHVEQLLADGVQPRSILLILDVDGTLTNFSNPEDIPSLDKLKARGEAVTFVKNMIAQGVNTVITSKWHSFKETLDRLMHIGLREILQIASFESYEEREKYELWDGTWVRYCHSGFVASVAYWSDMPPLYPEIPNSYNQKLLAYKLVHPGLEEQTITHVVCGDDSEQGILDAQRDLNTLKDKKGLFHAASAKFIHLSTARGEGYLK